MTIATRRERVVLELVDDFTPGMGRAAASTILFKRALSDLDGQAVKVDRALKSTSTSGATVSREFDRGASSIDQFSGRLGLAARALAAFGPAALPISAVAIPALTGLSAAMGATVLAGGTAVLAFQSVGDALGALNAAQLEPTAANLEKARQAFDEISPSARRFVLELDAAGPALDKLKMSAGADLFPGLTMGLQGALTELPRARALLEAVGGAVGNLGALTGDSLASGQWSEFLDFLTREAPPAIESLGRTVGNLAAGLAELWMAFAPLNNDVIGMLENGSQAFQQWADGLADTQGFQEFVDYIRTAGPQVGETLASIGNAVLQVVEAIAPLGGPSLQIIESLADAIATIADSPVGTPLLGIVAAMSALSLATRGYAAVQKATFGSAGVASFRTTTAALLTVTSAQERATLSAGALAKVEAERSAAVRGGLASAGKNVALLSGLALASSGAADKLNLSNTASLAMAGSLAGPWGAAVGGAIGLIKDFGANTDELTAQIEKTQGALNAVAPDGSGLSAASEAVRQQLLVINELQKQRQGAGLGRESDLDRQGADLAKQLASVRAETDVTKMSTRELAQAMSSSAAAAFQEAGGLQATIDAMREKRSAALEALNAELGYKGAVLDARDALKENGRTVNENTRAGQSNLQSLYALAAGFNAQSDAAKNAKGAVRDARANFVDVATAMGMAEDKARNLARRLFEIPPKVVVTVEAKDAATAKIQAIKSELKSILDEDVYVNIKTRRPNAGGLGPQIGSADGATVPGPRYPYGDKIHAFLAPGEEVISNRHGQADRHRDLLKRINANALADGGTVRRGTRARRSLRNLDVDLSVDETGASDALAQFADDVDTVRGFFKDAGIKWTKALDTQTDAVRQSARQYDAINATLTAARGNKASFASSVGSSLGKDVFGNGLAGFDAGVAANTNDFNTANSGLAAAIRNGLDGALLEALASSGDINALTQFGQLDAAGIAERERQFAAMQSAQSNFGNTAAGARYDGEIAKALADSARETKELRAELKKIGDRVERGARNGTHSGASQAGRDADTRTTQGTQTSGRGGGRRGGNR